MPRTEASIDEDPLCLHNRLAAGLERVSLTLTNADAHDRERLDRLAGVSFDWPSSRARESNPCRSSGVSAASTRRSSTRSPEAGVPESVPE